MNCNAIIVLLVLIVIGIFTCAFMLFNKRMKEEKYESIVVQQPPQPQIVPKPQIVAQSIVDQNYDEVSVPLKSDGSLFNDFDPYSRYLVPQGFKGDISPYNRFDGRPGAIGSAQVINPIDGNWRKVGLLTSINKKGDKKGDDKNDESIIFNLYQRTVSDYLEIFEFSIQDKNGFIIPLKSKRSGDFNRLEDGDVIDDILGYEHTGKYKVNIFNDSIFHYTPFV